MPGRPPKKWFEEKVEEVIKQGKDKKSAERIVGDIWHNQLSASKKESIVREFEKQGSYFPDLFGKDVSKWVEMQVQIDALNKYGTPATVEQAQAFIDRAQQEISELLKGSVDTAVADIVNDAREDILQGVLDTVNMGIDPSMVNMPVPHEHMENAMPEPGMPTPEMPMAPMASDLRRAFDEGTIDSVVDWMMKQKSASALDLAEKAADKFNSSWALDASHWVWDAAKEVVAQTDGSFHELDDINRSLSSLLEDFFYAEDSRHKEDAEDTLDTLSEQLDRAEAYLEFGDGPVDDKLKELVMKAREVVRSGNDDEKMGRADRNS